MRWVLRRPLDQVLLSLLLDSLNHVLRWLECFRNCQRQVRPGLLILGVALNILSELLVEILATVLPEVDDLPR